LQFDPSGGDILGFAEEELAAGRRVAIATLTDIDGSSPRAVGAQMAIAEDGRFCGSISSGCLERAIIAEAGRTIAEGDGGVIRYGKGSRFVDVVLPCGSGVDILFTVASAGDAITAALASLRARRSAALRFGTNAVMTANEDSRGFLRAYRPPIRLVIAGYGPELTLLAAIASAAGFIVCALSPDAECLATCNADETARLLSSSVLPEIAIDYRTACILLFHDREWERALAPLFLQSPAFYVGAVGGPKTAALRRASLQEDGLSEADIARLSAPVGLVPMTRDPSSLAVSILAEIVAKAPS